MGTAYMYILFVCLFIVVVVVVVVVVFVVVVYLCLSIWKHQLARLQLDLTSYHEIDTGTLLVPYWYCTGTILYWYHIVLVPYCTGTILVPYGYLTTPSQKECFVLPGQN